MRTAACWSVLSWRAWNIFSYFLCFEQFFWQLFCSSCCSRRKSIVCYLCHFFTYVLYIIKNWHSSFRAQETNDRGLKKLSIYAYPFIFTSYFLLFCFFLSAVLFDSIFGTFWYHKKAKYGFELSINVYMIENSQNISKNQFI